MGEQDIQYYKRCLASNGEVTVFDKLNNQVLTYANHNGKLVMKSGDKRLEGREAAISFLSLNTADSARFKVSKEGEHCINREFLGFLNQTETEIRAQA